MAEPDNRQQPEDIEKKAEELKKKAFEDEARRIEEESERKARELARQRLKTDQQSYQKELEEAERQKSREEQRRKAQEDEVQRVLDQERHKRQEARRRAEAEQVRREQEETRRNEERRIQEEVARQKAEEERLRREEEKRRQEEAEKKRMELDALRREQERLRREVEKQERIEALLKSAESFYVRGDHEHAAIEVAKALVNDPANTQALTLEQKIKDSQGKKRESVREEKPIGQAPEARQAAPQPAQARKSPVARYLVYLIVLGLVVLTSIIITQFRKKIFTTPVGIAVLPWTSPTGVTEDKIIGTALAQEVTAELSRMKPYLPMGYTSTFELVNLSPAPEKTIFRLGCPYVLEGTIAQERNKVFVNLRMLDSSNTVVWENQYSKPAELLHELPHEIARQIREVLRPATDAVAPGDMEHRTVNPEAYLLYLHGKELLRRLTPEGSANALRLFLEASEKDGSFAGARAAAATTLLARIERGWDTASGGIRRTEKLAEDARKLDPSAIDAYVALGKLAAITHTAAQGIQLLDTALLYAPQSSAIFLERARLYFQAGRYNEVIDAMAHAFELDPRNLEILQTFAAMHQLMGTPRQGIGYHETALSLVKDTSAYVCGPMGDMVLMDPGLTLTHANRVAEACQRLLTADSTDVRALYRLAQIEQITGNGNQAARLLAKLESGIRQRLQQQPKSSALLVMLALTLTREGRFPEATTYAERALDVDRHNPETYFGAARMYSLQMFSSKTNTVDAKKKSDAIRTLKQALAMSYRFDELASADFFNMVEQGALSPALHDVPGER